MKQVSRLALLLAACVCAIAMGNARADDAFATPRIVQTQNSAGAVLFWDATAWVETFASRDTPAAQALKEMQYKALAIFVSRATPLSRSERHLHMVVAFIRTGAISSRYHTKSVEDVQNLFTLDADLHRNMKFPKDWQSRARRGVLPPGIKLQVQSDMPSGSRP